MTYGWKQQPRSAVPEGLIGPEPRLGTDLRLLDLDLDVDTGRQVEALERIDGLR